MSDPIGTDRDRDALVEEVAGAFRPRRGGAVGSHAAWHDLDAEGREAAYARGVENRRLEAALDAEGYSSTVRAVLERIRQGGVT